MVALSDAALESPTRRHILAASAAGALQIVARSADMCTLARVLAAANLLRHLRRPILARGTLTLVGRGVLMAALGLGLSAAQWIPTLEMASRSSRFALAER